MTTACILRRQTSDIQSEYTLIVSKMLSRRVSKRANKTSIMLWVDPDLLAETVHEAQAVELTRSAVFQ